MVGATWLRHVSAGPEGAPQADAWVFLCEDYLEQRRWEDSIGGTRLDAAPALRSATERLREPFLATMAGLSRERAADPAWWASRVSERNTLVSPLFLRCCYLQAALALAARDDDRDLLIVCESAAVLESLARALPERARWSGPRPRRRRLERARRVFEFLVRGLSHHLRGPRRPDPPQRGERLALIRTWADEGSLTPDGDLIDRYFPGVAAWLGERGFRAVTMPVLFNLDRSWAEVWRTLAAHGYLAAETFYRASDYAYALRAGARLARERVDDVRVGDVDATLLFEEERRRTAFDGATLDTLLCARLPRRLAARGWRAELVLDPYENLAVSKLLILGFRADAPETRLVGYQHSTVPPLLLSHFVTAPEAGFAPLPDRVVCNGHFFRDVLVEEGLPAERAVVGPALRYRHVFDTRAGEGEGVLVALPLIRDGFTELLVKCVAALRDLEGVPVWLKAHPMYPRSAMPDVELPGHFEWVDGEMRDWLPRSRVLLALASATLVEAVAAGVPPIAVGRDAALDLNPLAWFPELGGVVSSPAEIRARVGELLALGPEELEEYRRHGREILARCFEPVTDESMRAFLPD